MKFKKKIIGLILSFLMIISIFTVLPFTAGAVNTDVNTTSATSGDFEYEILDDGTAEITGYNGEATELEIPSALDGYTVTSIGEWTFRHNANITSATIPSSVKYIKGGSFYWCLELMNITIPDSVTSIGENAFYRCKSLEKVTIGNHVTNIGGMAFHTCESLKNITIPDSVTSIGNSAFCNCTSLKKVIIGNGVTNIESAAFDKCKSLTSVTIGNNVKEIGWDAFNGCKNLKSVTIPKSVTNISYSAFGSYLDDNYQSHIVDNFTIMGYTGTEAERYAKIRNFKFINIGTAIILKKSSAIVYVKGTAQIKATVKKGNGKTTYKSLNKSVAKVSSKGTVTGLKKGTATITVTNNGVSKKFKVTVKNPKLNSKKKILKKGKSFKLSIKGKIGKATFKSSNKKIASVSKSGNIKALKKGTATITVKTNGMRLKCKVTIK